MKVDYLALCLYFTDILSVIFILLNYNFFKLSIKSLLQKKKSLAIFFVFALLVCLNIYFSVSPAIAIYKWLKILQLIALFYIFKSIKAEFVGVSKFLIFSFLIQLLLSTFHVLFGKNIGGIFYFLGERSFGLGLPGIAKTSFDGIEVLRAYGTFSHPNSMAGFFLLIYGFFLFYKDKIHLKKIYSYIILGVSTALIFLSFSKISISILLLLTVLNVYIEKRFLCTICKISKITVPFFLFLVVFSSYGDPESLGKRMFLTESAFSIIKDHFIFGVGAGNYLYYQSQIPNPYPYVFLQPVHNIFLLSLSEYGALIIAFSTLFFYKLDALNFFKSKRIVYLTIIVFVTGFFDHYWLTLQQNLLLLPVIFGLAKNIENKHKI